MLKNKKEVLSKRKEKPEQKKQSPKKFNKVKTKTAKGLKGGQVCCWGRHRAY